ncbi:thioredoxin H2-1-like [Oryza brachyantha]|uniref:thioredoxin H2-1-like n=1 Tax=Oryza brachyantha TaxID=4533 RepID=UPI0007763453|nr:thioredoxin H2-1-like [Oryza brachyantha]
MGGVFSSKSKPAAGGEPSAVVAVHSKAKWDELWEAHKTTTKLVVIDFSASWCGPCKMIEPVFKEMSGRFTDVVFLKVDVDELAEVARTWRVEAMPTFVLARGGEEVGRIVGANKDELERSINTFRSAAPSASAATAMA